MFIQKTFKAIFIKKLEKFDKNDITWNKKKLNLYEDLVKIDFEVM